ncbi:hypothetical protein [Dyella telluris]|uniref:hypothetical protein n=1 Tax=Dyella telluris TaxID=2763498 RepID=UPI001C9B57C5|nr:hypothetical protein [Dyella telluris]
MRTRHVVVKGGENVAFRRYRLPPNIRRGHCLRCGKPAIEHGEFGPLKITFIPTPNFVRTDGLPPVAMHMFYHRRLADASDGVPTHSGYLRSEWAFCRLLMGIL